MRLNESENRGLRGDMHKFVLGGTAIAGFMLGSVVAWAADLPVKAPPPAVVPYNWNGFHIGAMGSYAWGSDAITLTPDANFAPAFAAGQIPFAIAGRPHGALGGIDWGTDWQFGKFVAGFDSDISFGNIQNSATFVSGTAAASANQKLSWFGTTRVRGGYLVQDNVLIYATGGLASANSQSSFSFVAPAANGTCPVLSCAAGSDSKTLWGWAAGAGIEWEIDHWSAKLEYLHYDLGTLNYLVFDPRAPGAIIGASNRFSGDTVRVALSYRFFNWSPWQLFFGH
jgi:outer membrane immunogenic protein